MAEQTKFTPGPWEWEYPLVSDRENPQSLTIGIFGGGAQTYLADCYMEHVGTENTTREEMEANARLIAAAPEMYEALEAMRGEIAALVEDGTLECGAVVVNDGWLKLCAALAKARGEVS